MSQPRNPRHPLEQQRRRHQPTPNRAPLRAVSEPLDTIEHAPSSTTDLLAGAVRAELLGDDWRAAVLATRAELDPTELAAEADTEQGDEPETGELPAECRTCGFHWCRCTATTELESWMPPASPAVVESDGDPVEPGGVEWSEPDHCAELGHAPTMEGKCAACGADTGPTEPDEPETDDDFDLDAPQPAPEPEPLAPVPAPVEPEPVEPDAPSSVPVVDGRVLDWVSRHDQRSVTFAARDRLMGTSAPLQDRLWPAGPVFDQGSTPPLSPRDASGCGGFSTVAAVNAQRLAAGRSDLLTADDALKLYELAQKRDHVPGESYAGTSVLACMKSAVELGWVERFDWCFGTADIAQTLLQRAPVVLGLPWLSQMTVDAYGTLSVAGERTTAGHAIACVGLVLSHAGLRGPWFVLQQSYGTDVGDGGLLYLHHKKAALLLRGVGEAAVPVIGDC